MCLSNSSYMSSDTKYTTTKLYGTLPNRCNDNAVIQRKTIFTIPSPCTLTWQGSCTGDACESGNIAKLLNSLLSVVNISFLLTNRVKYYDYVVKWCNGAACN